MATDSGVVFGGTQPPFRVAPESFSCMEARRTSHQRPVAVAQRVRLHERVAARSILPVVFLSPPYPPTMGAVDAWSFYKEHGLERDRGGLGEVEIAVLAVLDLRQEVNSGGFDAYFRYWGGDTAPEALAALPRMLGAAWADLLRDAMALLGPDYPIDTNPRQERLDAAGIDDALDSMDRRFYDLEASIDADSLLTAFLSRAG